MDGTAAINHNLQALKRILAGLLAMAGLGGVFTSPLRGGRRSSDRRVGVVETSQPPPDASRRPPLKGEVKPSFTLPRHLRLAILRLLRPAESAARRLIIASARGLAVVLPAPRTRKPKPATAEPQLRRFGIAVVMSPADIAAAVASRRTAARVSARSLTLPLFDPPRRIPMNGGRRYVPAHAAPRILFPGIIGAITGKVETGFPSGVAAKTALYCLPPPPSRDDPVDATRLALRLAALAAALDDLPGQAKRFARWKARGAAAAGAQGKNLDVRRKAPAPGRRISPLRSARPPGGRLSRFDPSARRSSSVREIDEILVHAHALARYALDNPDTS